MSGAPQQRSHCYADPDPLDLGSAARFRSASFSSRSCQPSCASSDAPAAAKRLLHEALPAHDEKWVTQVWCRHGADRYGCFMHTKESL